VRFAYADPPYPGQAKRWYGNHPDYAGEVDHAELIDRLCRDYPDGWALSTSSAALADVLALCPPVLIAIWHVTNRNLRGNGRWELNWEPLIINGGRQDYGSAPITSATLTAGSPGRDDRFPGAKPPAFTRWMLSLLGAGPEDTIDDLYPGSGAVTQAIASWRQQPVLPITKEPVLAAWAHDNHSKRIQQMARTHDPLLLFLPLAHAYRRPFTETAGEMLPPICAQRPHGCFPRSLRRVAHLVRLP
jgi:hypothetical protein